jgi:hypothetical protein
MRSVLPALPPGRSGLENVWGRYVAPTPRALPLALGRAALPFVLAATGIAILGFSRGGYYATTWNWGTVAGLGVAGIAELRRGPLHPSRLEWAMPAGLVALLIWIGVGASATGSATRAIPELERGALYLAVVWAALLVLRPSNVAAALTGVLAGIVALSCAGLVSLLLPGRVQANEVEGRLLFEPLGYANACGILAVLGVMLALGTAAHGRRASVRTAAAATLVPLTAALALTSSRGAEAAAVIGLAALLVLDPQRRRVATTSLLLLPLPVIVASLALRSQVGNVRAPTALIARDGKLILAVILLMTLGQAAFASWLRREERRFRCRAIALRILMLTGSLLVLAVAVRGGAGSLGDRAQYWHAAWIDYRAHPLLGSGPGSFAVEWLRYRTVPTGTRSAHSLYLETLAELGPLGLVLLVATLAVPLVAAVKRRSSVTATACAAYVAFLAHAALDWDWQMPVVTGAALVCGAVVLACYRTSGALPGYGGAHAVRARALASVALALASLAAGLGNRALARADAAAVSGSWETAAALSRRASFWQPWASDPHVILGESYLATGRPTRARREFEQAVRLDPQDWRNWYELGRTGDSSTRRMALAEILRLNPFAAHPLVAR